MNEILRLEAELAFERAARQAAEQLVARLSDELERLRAEAAEQAEGRESSEIRGLRADAARASDDLDRAYKAVFRAERRLWNAIEAIPDGFALFDNEDRLVAANSAYRAIFHPLEDRIRPGIAYAEIPRIALEAGVVELEGRDPDAWLADILEHRRKNENESDAIVRHKGGVWLRFVDRRTADGDTVSLRFDITETRRREAALEEARRRAEAASRAKSAFLANMSHEIRTPMNGIIGMAELLGEMELDEEQRLYVDTIRHSGEALLTIINDILDYSKIEARKLTLQPEPFDLEACIHEVMMLLRPQVARKRVDLLLDYDIFMPTRFIGDAGRIRQVVLNLLGNAVKFTEKGHVLIRVVGIEKTPGMQEIHVTVEDTGIGIPPDKLDHVFGEFNQAEEGANRRYEGTGLGLAITRGLIDLMGGEIWVESEPGKGSCFGFRIDLPIATDVAPAAPPTIPPQLKRALVVDDIAPNLTIVSRHLAAAGIACVCRACPREALEVLDAEEEAIDVVITDYVMPGMDGFALARAIRERWPDLPVLLMSSVTFGRNDVPEGLFDKVLIKPCMRQDVLRALADLAPPDKGPGSDGGNAPSAAGRGGSSGRSAPRPRAGRARDVLVAEDNRTNRLVIGKLLEGLGLSPRFATDGRAAVAAWQERPPDIILMDVSMPEMDGLEATREIRRLEREAGRAPTPIVALTAHAMTADKERCSLSGMDDFLTKPVRKARLIHALRRWQILAPDDTAQEEEETG